MKFRFVLLSEKNVYNNMFERDLVHNINEIFQCELNSFEIRKKLLFTNTNYY